MWDDNFTLGHTHKHTNVKIKNTHTKKHTDKIKHGLTDRLADKLTN